MSRAWLVLAPAIAGSQSFAGSFGASQLGNCPEVAPWPELLGTIGEGAEAFKAGDFLRAKALLAEAADLTTGDEPKAIEPDWVALLASGYELADPYVCFNQS